MNFHSINILLIISLALSLVSNGKGLKIKNSAPFGVKSIRRILHQPLFTDSSTPPPGSDDDTSAVAPPPPPPPPPAERSGYGPDQPFFPEVPSTGSSSNPNQTPPSPLPPTITTNGSGTIPTTPQPTKPTKKVAMAVSVGIVTLGMLSAFAFYLYRHRVKHPVESQKLVGDSNSRAPPSNFLYVGTVEPVTQSSVTVSGDSLANGSPYQKLSSSVKTTSDRYRPSPDLQPLPPLSKDPSWRNHNSTTSAIISSDDEETRNIMFYTPNGSSIDDGFWIPAIRSISGSRTNSMSSVSRGDSGNYNAYSKRNSPKSRVLGSSPEVIKHAIIPSIKATPPTPPPLPLSTEECQPDEMLEMRSNMPKRTNLDMPPPPQLLPLPMNERQPDEKLEMRSNMPMRTNLDMPPPPPNLALLRAINSSPAHQKFEPSTSPPPPPPPPPRASTRPLPPPPPPPPPKASTPMKVDREVANGFSKVSPVSEETQFQTPSTGKSFTDNSVAQMNDNECSSSARRDGDEMDDRRPKLKPLHWDKVRATSDRVTVWDQLKSSSFQLNEDVMESLFGCNLNSVKKEPNTKTIVATAENQHRVLDPKKSQNIAILLRALNVTKDEVAEALTDGNPEGLGAELFETLVKMAPTKEEEIKLKDYSGDTSKLGAAERFLKGILDIPFAFRRVEAMLYITNFDTEVKYLTKSFDTLEVASEELTKSRLFLKLLEAVLQTGNRMNVGTNRGDAKAFKLDTLLKLVDIKGTDGKTTLLHFVVQEIIKSEGIDPPTLPNQLSAVKKETEFKRHGLQIVSGLSQELGSVKGAAGMDSDVLSNYVSKLETGLEKVKLVLQHETTETQGNFFESMRLFLKEAENQIANVKAHDRKALTQVREVTEYFHGDTAKEEAHPLRIFLVVRDFLTILDNVCKEVGRIDDRSVMGTAKSFRISAYA